MKKSVILTFLILAISTIYAQEGDDVGWVARFGIAGGVNPSYLFPNIDDVNAQAKSLGLGDLSKSGLLMWGGSGYAYIMFVSNLRLGGIGLSGSTSTSGNVNGLNREVDYNFGLGGVTVEYTLPFIKNVAVSVGAIIGVGSQSVEVYQNNTDYDWENVFNNIPPGAGSTLSDNEYYIIKNTFFTVVPTVNLDFPVSRFMALRLGGGYIINFNDNWKVNNGRDISGVSESLTRNNFFVQTGIYFGFFAF